MTVETLDSSVRCVNQPSHANAVPAQNDARRSSIPKMEPKPAHMRANII